MSGKSPRAKVRLQPPGTSERREQSRAARGWMALRADNQRHVQLRFYCHTQTLTLEYGANNATSCFCLIVSLLLSPTPANKHKSTINFSAKP